MQERDTTATLTMHVVVEISAFLLNSFAQIVLRYPILATIIYTNYTFEVLVNDVRFLTVFSLSTS